MNKTILLLCLLCCCTKTIKVQVDAVKGLEYVEPISCKFENNKIKYKTTIKDNMIAFDDENMEKFLQNLANQQIAIEKYKACTKTNDEYYKNIIRIILSNGKK